MTFSSCQHCSWFKKEPDDVPGSFDHEEEQLGGQDFSTSMSPYEQTQR